MQTQWARAASEGEIHLLVSVAEISVGRHFLFWSTVQAERIF
jgi:hypothetical protein